MDVLATNIPIEVVKAPKSKTVDKLSGSTSKSRDQASFANFLHSAAQPKRTRGELEPKADERNNVDQSVRLNGEVIPLFNTLSVMPAALGGADANDSSDVRSSTNTTLDQLVEANLNQSAGQANLSVFQTAAQGVLISDGNPQAPNNNTEDVSILTTLVEHAGQQQQSSITKANMMLNTNQDVVTNQTSDINQQDKYSGQELGNPNPDNQLKQETVKAVEQMLEVRSQSRPENLLKPLITAAAYQNASLISVNNEANKSFQVDEVVQVPDSAKESKVSLNTMIAAPSATNNGQEATNTGLVLEQNLSETKAVESISDKPVQSFQQMLHQTSMKDQTDVIEISSQPTPQLQQDTNNVVGQIVEHARLIKSPEMSEMVIKLKPEHLGELTLKVAVDNGVVSASFHTNNSEVRGIIEASVHQLRQDMAQQGLKVEYVGVYAGLGQPFSNGQGETNRQQTWKPQTTKKSRNDEFNESLDAIENTGATATNAGVDYRI